MKLGVIYPQNVIGGDPTIVRDFAQTVEGLGFSHIIVYDHVLGVNPAAYPDWRGPYTSADLFHDPFTLFSFMAGFTERIEFSPQIIILPQRQAVLVAKQAASLDVLSGGRLRLGIGIGWNEVEYVSLGQEIAEIFLENFWLIGTISQSPQPTIVSNRLGNAPQYKIQAFHYFRTFPYRTYQWYLKE